MKLNKLPLNVIGLNRVGLNQIGSPSHRANTSARPYIDPEVLASLVAVCICDGKSNDDPDRAVIKNLVDPDNPFVISNAAYKLNSGYGKYEVDFTIFNDITDCTIIGNKIINHSEVLFKAQYNYKIKRTDVESFNAKVENITKGYIGYTYRDNNGIEKSVSFTPETIKANNGIITLPKSYNTLENSTGVLGGLYGYGVDKGVTITQIPSFEGALVTDGKDDMITSTKTAQEMLSGSNEITVVSMVHQITTPNNNNYTNIIRYDPNTQGLTNIVQKDLGVGKAGIYGYSANLSNSSISVINNILGDKSDYIVHDAYTSSNISAKYSVQGWMNKSNSHSEISSVAWYWTIIANKVLTTDQINQVISYFNLDKHVKPDVYYDVKKQGLSNDTPEADWYLKDFSGNGHDMTLYNFAKKLDSGIGKYKVDFNTWIPQSYVADSTYTSNKLHVTNIKGGNAILYTKKGANAMKVKITGIQSFNLVYRYIAENDVWEALEVDRDGIYELPASTTTTKTYYTGFTVPYYTGDCDITIEQIPDYEGALVSDGIDDYGKVENLPIYKDYTVVADREIIDGLAENADGGVAVRGTSISNGAFGFDYKNEVYSFATPNSKVIDVERFISYQSKYVNNGTNINAGNIVDANPLTIGKLGSSTDRYSKLALWSFLLFPYTLSEFLLERQLKRYKLGTLYPNMVEFRPIVKSNREYSSISYSVNPGEYISVDSMVTITVTLPNTSDKLIDVSCNAISDISISGDNGVYKITGKVVKSPQKIGIAIESDV